MQKRFKKLGASAAAALLAVTASCGGTVPFGAAAADKPQLSYSVLAGGSQIGLKFKVTPPEGGTASDYGLLVNGDPYSLTDGVYGFGVNAAEMAEPITVAVTKGTTIAVAEQTVSVSGFLQTITDDAAYGDVAKAMLNYGYAAQDFFGSAAPADYGLTAAPDFSGLTISESAFANKTEFNSALADTAVQYYGMNLTLLDQIRFSLYFSNTGEQADAISYLGNSKFGGETATAYDISPTFSRIYATVPASKLSEQLKFENGSVSETFSPVQYLAAASAGDDAKLAALCKALYAYGEAAANVQESDDPQEEIKWNTGYATRYEASAEGGCANLDQFAVDNHYPTCAVNETVYANGKMAGAYLEIINTGNNKTMKALVTNRDGNSQMADGDLDFLPDDFELIRDAAGERADIKWRVIPLETEDPVIFRFKATSTIGWCEVQVQNHRYPLVKLEVKKNGEYVEIMRQGDYNFFLAADNDSGIDALDNSGFYQFRLTDINNNVIEETVNVNLSTALSEDKYVVGTKQFPA